MRRSIIAVTFLAVVATVLFVVVKARRHEAAKHFAYIHTQEQDDHILKITSRYAAEPPTPAKAMIVGDSVVEFGAWEPMLNRGVGFETTGHLVGRIPELRRHKAGTLLILSGVNDLYQGVPQATILENLRKVAESGIAPKVVVIGVLPSILPQDLRAAEQALDAQIQTRAKSWGAEYVAPPATYDPQSDTRDGLHPNAEGYRKVRKQLQLTDASI